MKECEALLAQLFQEGTKRFGAGLARQSDCGPPPSSCGSRSVADTGCYDDHVAAQVTWEESSRDGSQRPGSDGKREALLARWLQEGNKRLRERLNAGLSRQSDPGPPPFVSSGPASVKVGHGHPVG